MSQYFIIHPENPQQRLIQQAVQIIRKGGVIIYPTDSAYAIGCHIGDKDSLDRIRRIRQLDENHPLTLICRDISEVSQYAKIDDNRTFRLIKANIPGSFTFSLPATKEVPRRLLNPKRKTIGIRIPDNQILLDLLRELNEPLLSTSLILPGKKLPLADPLEIREILEHQVDLIIDGGNCGLEPTTVIDLLNDEPIILRQGKGQLKL